MNYKKEKFQIAGVSHYSDSIMKDIAYENDDYLLSVKELSETYDVGDRVFEYSFDDCNASLVPEPTNEHDPNAVRVEVKGILIGYVKRGSCSHVKNLLKSPDFDHVKVEIGGGKYKRLYEDDDKLKVEKDSCGLFADLYIYTRQAEQEPESAPVPPAATSSPAVGSSYSGSAPSPAAAPEKKKGGAASIALIVIGVLFLIGGVGNFPTDIFTGFVGLLIGGVCLYFGIRKRRNLKQ